MPATIITPTGDRLTFDAELSFSVAPEDAVTSHPVEDGVEVSDHVQARPLTVSMVAVMNDRGAPGLAFQPAATGRIALAAAWIERIRGKPVTLVHPRHGVLQNMVHTRSPRTTGNTERAEFAIGFTQVVVARRQTAVLPPLALRPRVNLGQQATDRVEATERDRTIAAALSDASGGTDLVNDAVDLVGGVIPFSFGGS